MAFSICRRLWPSTYFFAALLALAALLPLPQNNVIAGVPSICLFHNFTGLPCPGCGLTRSWVAMAHGHAGEALVWHPLGPLLFLSALGYTLWSGWTALKKPPFAPPHNAPPRNAPPHNAPPRKLQTGALVAVSLLMLAFWALRLGGVFPLPGG